MPIRETNVVNIVITRFVMAIWTCGVAVAIPVEILLTTDGPMFWNMTHAAISVGIHAVIAVFMPLNAEVTDEFKLFAVVVIEVALVEKLVTAGFS